MAEGHEVPPIVGDFDLLTVIGCGCDGAATVSVGLHNPSRKHVAIKRINLEKSQIDFNTIQHEVSMAKSLCHPNVLPNLCSFVHNKEVWIVTPLAGYGSCRDLLHAHFVQGLQEQTIAYILRDVLQALDYIHKKGLIHRSVKASHILVSSSGQVMLAGLRHSYSMMSTGKRARCVHDFPRYYDRSLLWASPELLEQNLAGYDTKSDIYSVGITACELANGVAPFSDMPVTQMLLEKTQGVMPRLLDSATLTASAEQLTAEEGLFQRTFSAHFHNFVEICLKGDPAQRPTAAALSQHAFFKQLKRKSQSDCLPAMLDPVQPLSAIELPRDDLSAIDDLAQAMEETMVQEPIAWDF